MGPSGPVNSSDIRDSWAAFLDARAAGAPEEAPPDATIFDHLVDQVLCVDFPAFIVDSLY